MKKLFAILLLAFPMLAFADVPTSQAEIEYRHTTYCGDGASEYGNCPTYDVLLDQAERLDAIEARLDALEAGPVIPPEPEPEPIPTGVQAQIVWALDLMLPYQEDVNAFYDANGYFPNDNSDIGLPPAAEVFMEDSNPDPDVTDYGPLSDLNILNGKITVTFRASEPYSATPELDFYTIMWYPEDFTGVVLWFCGSDSGIPNEWRPAECRQ